MADFVSEIKSIPHSDARVFGMLSDLSNLERVKERRPELEEKFQNMSFDSDSCRFTVAPVGEVEFRIVEREPNKTIKLITTNSPVALTMWIQLKQVSTEDTRMKMTVRADLNPLVKPLVSKPLQEAVNRISDVLAGLDYSIEYRF